MAKFDAKPSLHELAERSATLYWYMDKSAAITHYDVLVSYSPSMANFAVVGTVQKAELMYRSYDSKVSRSVRDGCTSFKISVDTLESSSLSFVPDEFGSRPFYVAVVGKTSATESYTLADVNELAVSAYDMGESSVGSLIYGRGTRRPKSFLTAGTPNGGLATVSNPFYSDNFVVIKKPVAGGYEERHFHRESSVNDPCKVVLRKGATGIPGYFLYESYNDGLVSQVDLDDMLAQGL